MEGKEGVEAKARGRLYKCFSWAFWKPEPPFTTSLNEGLWASVVEASAETLGLSASAIRPSLQETSRALAPETLEQEQLRLFELGVPHLISPYETDYLTQEAIAQAQQLSDIAGFYRAFGTEIEAKERVDHLALELEFLHLLAFKEAKALEEDQPDHLEITRKAQAKFLQEHLGRWVGLFARQLRQHTNLAWYRVVGELLEALVARELKAFGFIPEALPARRSPGRLEDICGACER